MLTKNEVNQTAAMVLSLLPGRAIRGVHDAVLKLNKQAMQAITLAEENERLKNTLNSIAFLLQTQNDGVDKTNMIRELMAKYYRKDDELR